MMQLQLPNRNQMRNIGSNTYELPYSLNLRILGANPNAHPDGILKVSKDVACQTDFFENDDVLFNLFLDGISWFYRHRGVYSEPEAQRIHLRIENNEFSSIDGNESDQPRFDFAVNTNLQL